MSITEDAPAARSRVRRPVRRPGHARRASPWWWLVGASALLLAGVAVVMAVWWAASRQTRTATYRVIGTLTALELDVGDAAVEITGGAGAVEVRRTEEFAFGRPPGERRAVDAGRLRISSRCPDSVIGTCRTGYRIAVPDNVRLDVRTSAGRVHVAALNGSARITTGAGAIAVDAFCGFLLSATSSTGDVRASADCSPDRVQLRSGSGDVHAVVPPGRYRVDADSDAGEARVSGLTVADDASYGVQAFSGSGDVVVEAGG
jgi:hypothetical protein